MAREADASSRFGRGRHGPGPRDAVRTQRTSSAGPNTNRHMRQVDAAGHQPGTAPAPRASASTPVEATSTKRVLASTFPVRSNENEKARA